MRWSSILTLGTLVAFALQCGTARAQEAPGLDFSGSGFLSVAAGKVLSGTHDAAEDLGYHCPCFISDYAQNGVYEDRGWQAGPDSKLGLQGVAATQDGRYSATVQVVARGAGGGQTDLEWLYATADLSSNWTLQVGRKRLPLFQSSEVQDVGYAIPWIHLPPQLYGWEIVNYNGASLTYRNTVGSWLATADLLTGTETIHNSEYWQIYNGKFSVTDTRWTNIVGADATVSRDWFEARAVLIQSDQAYRFVSDGETAYEDPTYQKIYGISFKADDGKWLARAEFLYINRQADYGFDHAQLYAAGYRFGPFTPLLSYSNYQQTTNLSGGPAEGHSTRSLVTRYELDHSSDVKMEFDVWVDKSAPGFQAPHGNSHLLSFSYDRVF